MEVKFFSCLFNMCVDIKYNPYCGTLDTVYRPINRSKDSFLFLNWSSQLTLNLSIDTISVYILVERLSEISLFIYLQERLTHLKRQCEPHLYEAAEESVKGICTKIYKMSCETVNKINDKTWEVLKEHNISGG